MSESPIIKFLGLFDTVQMSRDAGDIDVSTIQSIKVIRHALALNEERVFFPLSIYDHTNTPDSDTSILQAWFVGTHVDIGGGTEHDGLSLYPLQWMLVESKLYGLVLEHNDSGRLKGLIEDPLNLVFPSPPSVSDTQIGSDSGQPVSWVFKYSNGLEISMYDIRLSHNHGNIQKIVRNKLQKRRTGQKGKVVVPDVSLHRRHHFVRINVDLWGQIAHSTQFGKRKVFRDPVEELTGHRLNGYSQSGKSFNDQPYRHNVVVSN